MSAVEAETPAAEKVKPLTWTLEDIAEEFRCGIRLLDVIRRAMADKGDPAINDSLAIAIAHLDRTWSELKGLEEGRA